MYISVVFLAMVFCHIVDDYYLQGILAQMKQRKWWEDNAPDKMYKHDYIMALFMHSFSWAFMIHLPIMVWYASVDMLNALDWVMVPTIILNCIIHMIVDHLKANVRLINLIVDQSIHLTQIMCTFILYASIYSYEIYVISELPVVR